jgi:hypothetical protein
MIRLILGSLILFSVVACNASFDDSDSDDDITIIDNPVLTTPTPVPGGSGGDPSKSDSCYQIGVSNPGCDVLAFGDGVGGDLWKIGERTNKPVLILDQDYQGQATVQAELASGGFETFVFSGCANPTSGKQRQHHRSANSCTSYTGKIIVTDATKSCEFNLPGSVCARID